jgi:hypothetical protein
MEVLVSEILVLAVELLGNLGAMEQRENSASCGSLGLCKPCLITGLRPFTVHVARNRYDNFLDMWRRRHSGLHIVYYLLPPALPLH